MLANDPTLVGAMELKGEGSTEELNVPTEDIGQGMSPQSQDSQEIQLIDTIPSQGSNNYYFSDEDLYVPSSVETSLRTTKRRFRPHVPKLVVSTGLRMYGVPKGRFKWGEKQTHPPHAWASLFFDLTYVGVAFQLSHAFTDGLNAGVVLDSLGLFMAIYISMEALWGSKMGFDARYDADDLFHRVLSILQGAVVSYMANAISSVETMNAEYRSLTYSTSLLVYTLLDTIPYLELMLTPVSPSHAENVVASGRIGLQYRMIPMVLFLIPAVISSALVGPLWLTAMFWFLYGTTSRLMLLAYSWLGWLGKKKNIPMHIHWCIGRYGEFLMLMLGESIISIIITSYQESSAGFSVTYFFAYFLIATMGLSLFASFPVHEDRHALRRNIERGIFYTTLVSTQGGALILVGAGFRLVLSTSIANSPPPQQQQAYVWLLSSAFVVYFLAVMVGQMIHHGFREEFVLPQQKGAKMMFWTAKLTLVGISFVAPVFYTAPPYAPMIYLWGLACLIYIVQLADLKHFKEHHEVHVSKEVAARHAAYMKATSAADATSVSQSAHLSSAVKEEHT